MKVHYKGHEITAHDFEVEMGRKPVDENDILKVADWLLEVEVIEQEYMQSVEGWPERDSDEWNALEDWEQDHMDIYGADAWQFYMKRRAGAYCSFYPEELRLRKEARQKRYGNQAGRRRATDW